MWLQIEDFIDAFNCVYVITDATVLKRGGTKRFISHWLPNDYIGGAAGPPIIIADQNEEIENPGNIKIEKNNYKYVFIQLYITILRIQITNRQI